MTSPDNHRPGHAGEPEPPFVHRARQLWSEAARNVDPATAGRLRAARRHALESSSSPTHLVRWLIPAGACAAIALAALVVHQPLPETAPVATMHATITADPDIDDGDGDLPPDADQADPDLYQDLDFYGWLAANNNQMAAH